MDDFVSAFVDTVHDIFHEGSTPKRNKLKSWITPGLKNSIRNNDKLSKSVRSEPLNCQLRYTFHRFMNILHSLIKRVKLNFYKHKLMKCGGCKSFGLFVIEVASRPSKAFGVHRCRHPHSKTAQNCNKYFSSVGTQLVVALQLVGTPEAKFIKTTEPIWLIFV